MDQVSTLERIIDRGFKVFQFFFFKDFSPYQLNVFTRYIVPSEREVGDGQDQLNPELPQKPDHGPLVIQGRQRDDTPPPSKRRRVQSGTSTDSSVSDTLRYDCGDKSLNQMVKYIQINKIVVIIFLENVNALYSKQYTISCMHINLSRLVRQLYEKCC